MDIDYGDTEIEFGVGDLGKSRSQKKRDSSALQGLGEELARLSPVVLREMDMPAVLLDALVHFQSITKHEGKRRQMQYIGRLMRDVGSEIREDLSAKLEVLKLNRHAQDEELHLLEKWRDELIDPKTRAECMAQLVEKFPDMEERKIRHLAEMAEAAKANSKPPKASRELFKVLRSLGN